MKKRHDKLTPDLEERAYEEETASADLPEPEEPQEEEDVQEKLKTMEQDCAEWKDKYLRSMAEFENYRRRSIQEKADWIKLATQKLALDVCDVADNFERALLQVEPEQKDSGFVRGVQMIEQQLRAILEKEGVSKIAALGEEFDPAVHEALAHIPSDYDADRVAAVIQNGYTMHGKVLRPVRVAVSSGKIDDQPQEPETVSPESQSGGNGEGSETIEIEVQ